MSGALIQMDRAHVYKFQTLLALTSECLSLNQIGYQPKNRKINCALKSSVGVTLIKFEWLKNPSTLKEELILVENLFCGTKLEMIKYLSLSCIIADRNLKVSQKDQLYSPKYNTLLRHGSLHKSSSMYLHTVSPNLDSHLET